MKTEALRYEAPLLELVLLAREDVITTSKKPEYPAELEDIPDVILE